MSPDKKSTPSTNKNISISRDVRDSAVFIGDNNTVNQTIIQKFFNIFKGDSETLEHRNRRILLGHVENAWIKGVLDASLHGAALLDLGIKQDPEAVTKYPWAIKKESTDETLPIGTSMLEIFDSIGMGRSLLILGAPGSGKTTMLLELARQLIARAREDVTYPIPMVFNLTSWTEKLTLADWLAQELNNLYSVPRKTAPNWVKGNKLFLLLDGLDEVRQESRAKCVEAINAFRKEYGLTSLAVCSRSQDYADLNAKLSFEGAIEVQPLTQEQITEFFNRLGKEMAGIKQVLKKDSALREMAETPLFLSIMIMAYRDKQDVEILVSKNKKVQRKYLFNTYIDRMFERPRSRKVSFRKQDILKWVSWLAHNMLTLDQTPFFLEEIYLNWLSNRIHLIKYKQTIKAICALLFGLIPGIIAIRAIITNDQTLGILASIFVLLFSARFGWSIGDLLLPSYDEETNNFSMIDSLRWNWIWTFRDTKILAVVGLVSGLLSMLVGVQIIYWLILFGMTGVLRILVNGLRGQQIDRIIRPGHRLLFSIRNFVYSFLIFGLVYALIFGSLTELIYRLVLKFDKKLLPEESLKIFGPLGGWIGGLFTGGLIFGGFAIIQYCTLRFVLARNNLLPWRLVPFLDHCVDLIFLRRVGGGYIFVHRLLMEHFAEMYVEDNA